MNYLTILRAKWKWCFQIFINDALCISWKQKTLHILINISFQGVESLLLLVQIRVKQRIEGCKLLSMSTCEIASSFVCLYIFSTHTYVHYNERYLLQSFRPPLKKKSTQKVFVEGCGLMRPLESKTPAPESSSPHVPPPMNYKKILDNK